MTVTAFDLLTEEQLKPFIRHSQLDSVLLRARLLAENYGLTSGDVERLADAAYWMIEDFKEGLASNGMRSIIKQFDLPFEPEHPESVSPLEALTALSDIREDEPWRQDGEAIERAADNVLRAIHAPGVSTLEVAAQAYDLSEITLTPSLIFVAYAADILAIALEPSGLGEHSDLSRLAFAALEAVEAVNYAEKLMIIGGAVATYQQSEQERLIVKEKLTRGYACSLAKIQKAKDKVVERALAIATELWQSEGEQKTRIGIMADRVYRAMVDEGLAHLLPGSADRIRVWITPVAPADARKPGKPRKSP